MREEVHRGADHWEAPGKAVPEAVRKLGVAEQTY
jgi:hypothetical protein